MWNSRHDDVGKGCKMQMQASCKHQVLSKPGENKIELFLWKKGWKDGREMLQTFEALVFFAAQYCIIKWDNFTQKDYASADVSFLRSHISIYMTS